MGWHLISGDGLPKESGRYLISKFGVLRSDEPEKALITYEPDFRYVDVALYVRDVGMFDTKFPNSVYAWAELPDPAKY